MIERLEIIRNDNKLSQKDFAEILSIAEHSYSKMKANRRSLQIDEVSRVANEFGINLNWLILGLGEKYDQNNNFESMLSKLIDTTNNQYGDNEFVKKLLINAIIKKIDEKVKIKENLNQRPLFMFRKILKNIKIEDETINTKEFFKIRIKESKDPFPATFEKLHYKIDGLTNDECYFIMKNRELFISILEEKVEKLDLVGL